MIPAARDGTPNLAVLSLVSQACLGKVHVIDNWINTSIFDEESGILEFWNLEQRYNCTNVFVTLSGS